MLPKLQRVFTRLYKISKYVVHEYMDYMYTIDEDLVNASVH